MAQMNTAQSAGRHKLILLETAIHLLAGGVVFLRLGGAVTPEVLYTVIAVISAMTALRVFAALLASRGASISGGFGERPGLWETRVTLALGLVWGGIAVALEQFATPTPGWFYPFALAAGGAGLAVYSGSALNTRLLAGFALLACGPPLAWYGQSLQIEAATAWLFLLLVLLVLSRASSSLDELIERFLQISRGNTELVKNLARTRDAALAAQRAAETANRAIKSEIREREKAEEKIKASESELTRILTDMMDTYFHVDQNDRIVRVSPSIELMLGYKPDDLRNQRWSRLFANSAEHGAFQYALEDSFGTLQNHEVRLRHRDGHNVWVSLNAHYHQDRQGHTDGFEGVARDTTEARLAKAALAQEKELWRVTLESIGDGVITTDLSGQVNYLNPVAEKMTGWPNAQARGRPLSEVMQLVAEDDREEAVTPPMDEWLEEGRRASLPDPAILLKHGQGDESAIELAGAPIRDSQQQIIGSVMVFHDVTKLRALAMQLSYQATHDALTGLINRVEFDTRVERAIHSANRGEKQHALCYIDLDQFKVVNDTCGHPAGDELLRQITRILRGALRESDVLARLGGDEFGVLLIGCPLSKAADIAEKLRQLVEDYRFIWEDKLFRVGASVGVVPISDTDCSLTELMKAADSACYVAKEKGRNRVHVSQPDDREIAEHHGQMQWMQRIQRAVEDDEFALYIQSIEPIDRTTQQQRHSELLLRMIDGRGSKRERVIPPAAFLPAAERYHLMPLIDRWVLEKALGHLAAGGPDVDDMSTCSINLSGQSLSDMKMFSFITDLIRETAVDPQRLCFEITESAVIANMDVTQQFVCGLRDIGCRFALDDFGSGLSTFEYLKRLPVDYVKLDGTLVRDVATSRVSQAMVHAVNYVVHVMGMKSIAEFVESAPIMDALRKLSVDYAQGYAIEKPRPFC